MTVGRTPRSAKCLLRMQKAPLENDQGCFFFPYGCVLHARALVCNNDDDDNDSDMVITNDSITSDDNHKNKNKETRVCQ